MLLIRLVVCAAVVCAAVRADAQTVPFVEASGELSPVSIGDRDTIWRIARLSGGVLDEGRAGVTVVADRQQRDALTDWTAGVSAFRRAGDWTLLGAAGFTPDADFLYRRSLEAEVARRLVGSLVVHGGYRHLAFPAVSVHIAQPAASLYFRRGELQGRTFIVRNRTLGRTTTTVLVRGLIDASSRLTLGGGVAVGSRIFDVAALSEPEADGWVAFGYAQVRLSPQWSLNVGAGGAREDPLFTQRTVSVGLRRSFR